MSDTTNTDPYAGGELPADPDLATEERPPSEQAEDAPAELEVDGDRVVGD